MNNISRMRKYKYLLIILLVTIAACSKSSQDAKQLLKAKGIRFTGAFFIEAINEGNLEHVKLFLDGGMDPEYIHPTGYTILTYAAKEGHTDIARLLIKRGASVNNIGNQKDLPLSVVIASGEFDSFTLFIRNKAALGREGDTPPISAAIKADIEYDKKLHIVKYLVKYGADVNGKDNGQTCLSVSKAYKEKEIEDYLVSVGAHY